MNETTDALVNHRTLTHEEAEALKARAKTVLALLPTHRDPKTVAERYAECVLIAETHKELNDIFTFGRISLPVPYLGVTAVKREYIQLRAVLKAINNIDYGKHAPKWKWYELV
jgi:hypothetical protein